MVGNTLVSKNIEEIGRDNTVGVSIISAVVVVYAEPTTVIVNIVVCDGIRQDLNQA